MGTEGKVTEYRILVIGISEDGHPIQRISYSLRDAAEIMDQMVTAYPNNEVQMHRTVEELLKLVKPRKKPRPRVCPRGHGREIDGKPVVAETGRGYYCNICGDFFTSPALQQ